MKPFYLSSNDYSISWICAITTEFVAARVSLDETHRGPATRDARDTNSYKFRKVGEHKVAIAALPMGEYGTASAADVAVNMLRSFPNIRIGLMAGISRGEPSPTCDIRLGDVVVNVTTAGQRGLFRCDFGKSIQEKSFKQTRTLNQPPQALLAVVATLKSDHVIDGNGIEYAIKENLRIIPRLRRTSAGPMRAKTFCSNRPLCMCPITTHAILATQDTANDVRRVDRTKDDTGTQLHYGTITSASMLMKNAIRHDVIASQKEVLCFEMEARDYPSN